MSEAVKQETVDVQYEARTGIITRADYERLYKESLDDPNGFWAKFAEDFHWKRKVSRVASSIQYWPKPNVAEAKNKHLLPSFMTSSVCSGRRIIYPTTSTLVTGPSA